MSIKVFNCNYCNNTYMWDQMRGEESYKCQWCYERGDNILYKDKIKKLPKKSDLFMKKIKGKYGKNSR